MQSHEEGWKQPTVSDTTTTTRRSLSPMLIGFAIVAIGAFVFIVQNSRHARVNFLMFDENPRQWVNLLVAMAVGIALDRLLSLWWHRRRRRAGDSR